MAYAILELNWVRYVDKSIILIENVPKLLSITGFLKSSLTFWGWETIFKIIKIKNIDPMVPKRYLKYGWMSCSRFPRDNNARTNPLIGRGIFLIKFIISLF